MAEKILTESAWSSFAKTRGLDDGALLKALARFNKTDEAQHRERIDALDELDVQLKKQLALAKRKTDKPGKELKQQLDEMLEAAQRLHKAAEAAGAAAADDDEADTPALLTSKMLPLLRELKKGEVGMSALIATAGRETAVLIMRRPIATSRRKLLAEAVDAKGGVKYIAAGCRYEEGVLTFVVQAPAGGLAKRLRAALLTQSGLRLKVRIRGDDDAVDEDGDAGDDASEVEGGSAAAAQPQPRPPPGDSAAESTAGRADDMPAPAPPNAAAQAYQLRLQDLLPQLQAALAERRGDTGKMRAVAEFAREKAAATNFGAATEALNALERLLAAASPGAQTQAQPSSGGLDLTAWDAALTLVVTQLRTIAKEVAAAGHAQSAPALIELNAVIKQLTAKPDTLQKVGELERWLSEDRVVAEVCEYAEDVRTPLLACLQTLRSRFEAIA